MLRQITGDLPRLRELVDQQLQRELASTSSSLREVLQRDGGYGQTSVESLILRVARVVVRDQLRGIDLEQLFRDSHVSDKNISAWVQRELESATPRLLTRCGGASRLLVAIPEQSSMEQIRRCLEGQFNENPSIVQATRGDVVMCYEVEQIPLVNVASNLIRSRPDCADLVAHLHTRTDVHWTPLVCPE